MPSNETVLAKQSRIMQLVEKQAYEFSCVVTKIDGYKVPVNNKSQGKLVVRERTKVGLIYFRYPVENGTVISVLVVVFNM